MHEVLTIFRLKSDWFYFVIFHKVIIYIFVFRRSSRFLYLSSKSSKVVRRQQLKSKLRIFTFVKFIGQFIDQTNICNRCCNIFFLLFQIPLKKVIQITIYYKWGAKKKTPESYINGATVNSQGYRMSSGEDQVISVELILFFCIYHFTLFSLANV